MSIPSSLIVVIQNEPRDGDIVYVEKDLEAFRNRVVGLNMVDIDGADEVVELGQTYYNDEDSSTITGYEVKLPYAIHNTCGECFMDTEGREVGSHLVVNFVAEADCENCKKEE